MKSRWESYTFSLTILVRLNTPDSFCFVFTSEVKLELKFNKDTGEIKYINFPRIVKRVVYYPVLSSSALASLSLQAYMRRKAVNCWLLKLFFCFLYSSIYDSSVKIGFMYFWGNMKNNTMWKK